MSDETQVDPPSNTVMKILIGILIFVFVGIPLIAILIIAGLIALGSSLSGTFEEGELQSPAPISAPQEHL